MELQGKKVEFEVKGKRLQKTVRVFLGGDYQFLCTNFGHGGASSTSFCLFCKALLVNKADCPADLEILWGEGETVRTLGDLMATYGVRPVFPIGPEMTVPLPLHIMLGLVKDYGDMFREEVRVSLLSLFVGIELKTTPH